MNLPSEFHWLSYHGLSVILFLIYGFVYVLIGCLTPFFLKSPLDKPGIIISYNTDKKLFGDEPSNIMKENHQLEKLRLIVLPMLAGMLVVAGLLMLAVTWFGLKHGHVWAISILTITGIVVLPFWWFVFKLYLEAGIKITLADAPPFMWVPAMLYLPAIIFGWIGVK